MAEDDDGSRNHLSRRGPRTAAGLAAAAAAVVGLSLAFDAEQDAVTPPGVAG